MTSTLLCTSWRRDRETATGLWSIYRSELDRPPWPAQVSLSGAIATVVGERVLLVGGSGDGEDGGVEFVADVWASDDAERASVNIYIYIFMRYVNVYLYCLL